MDEKTLCPTCLGVIDRDRCFWEHHLCPGLVFCGKNCCHEFLAKQKNRVHSPIHYTQGTIECIDAIQSALTPEEFRGFCKGNALKYLWRERHKGGQEDLQKAGDYLRRLGEEKA